MPAGQFLVRTFGQSTILFDRQILMVEISYETGAVAISEGNGRIKAIKLLETASSHLLRIGVPDARLPLNNRFMRRVKSEAGVSWIEHHPRCTYDPAE